MEFYSEDIRYRHVRHWPDLHYSDHIEFRFHNLFQSPKLQQILLVVLFRLELQSEYPPDQPEFPEQHLGLSMLLLPI